MAIVAQYGKLNRPVAIAGAFAFVFAALVGATQAATIAVGVDVSQDRRAIDPQIYGVNFGTTAQLSDPGYTVRRWGGNSTTRYNYQVDVHNTASDYFYLNFPTLSTSPPNDSTANRFLSETLASAAEPILTIGTIGWTPLGVREKRYGFAIAKYGPQLQNGAPFDSAGGNGECNVALNATGYCVDTPGNGPHLIVGNDPADTSFVTGPDWTRQWISHLRQRHGTGANGGVRYYALDNEVMLWNSTHRDVHPQPATYDEIWQKTVAHASAIKAEEPAAQVFGPVTWGYCDLFSSAADGCLDGADRNAHGDVPFVPWYLRQVCAHQQQTGVRLVDYLDLHYYPQGEDVIDFNSSNLAVSENAATSAKRLRSLKELYDPAWIAESWFADLGDNDYNHYDKPQFIRRVKAWIAAECPGTRLAITEYNWGPDLGASGALAQAEVLAIFGREGVDLATRWVAPTPGSLAERAFRLFLDYDGNGARVVGDSVRALSANVDALGAYAVDLPGQRLMLLLFNKDTQAHTAQLSLAAPLNGAWTLYRFDAGSDVAAAASGSINGSALVLANLPPRSANLLVLPAASPGDADIFGNGFESP
ncbi:MAG: glycoside hydrolase family 44 protein [Chiayiivirga sp.]|nr:glycoside hydrolase family 44 protein [Chiayiivirga sp.]